MHQAGAATLGITLALCYAVVSRARGESSRPSRARRRPLEKRRESEGFVDLIRDESELLRRHEEVAQPSLSRTQLTAGRLVVVIIGPSSTGVHQVRLGPPRQSRSLPMFLQVLERIWLMSACLKGEVAHRVN